MKQFYDKQWLQINVLTTVSLISDARSYTMHREIQESAKSVSASIMSICLSKGPNEQETNMESFKRKGSVKAVPEIGFS